MLSIHNMFARRVLPALSRSLTRASRDLAPATTHAGIRHFSRTAPFQQARHVRFGGDPRRPWDTSKWDTMTKVGAGVVVLGGVYYVAHLEQVPETGRWRFMDVNPKYESALAQESYEQLIQEFKGKILPPDHPLTRHVRRVVTRILDANSLGTLKGSSPPIPQLLGEGTWDPDGNFGQRTEDVNPGSGGREWQLMVVNDDKVVNAMASFGNVVVFTGILPVAKDEEGLAAILGHEIGHVVARHNSERYSSAKVLIFVAFVLETLGLDFGFARLITTLFLDLPNSRTQELEADRIGLKLMAKSCYDPRAAPDMFSRMDKVEQKSGRLNVSFLYTHPTSQTRIQKLEAMLPEAYTIQAAQAECSGLNESFSAFKHALGFGGKHHEEPSSSLWKWA